MLFKKSFLLSGIILMFSFGSQGQEIGVAVTKYFDDVRGGKNSNVPPVLLAKGNEQTVIDRATSFLRDSTSSVRRAAMSIVHNVGNRADKALRAKSLTLLISVSTDKIKENRNHAFSLLSSYLKADFTNTSKDSLSNQIIIPKLVSPALIKLLGFINASNATLNLQHLSQPGNPPQIRWAALLALSRMGDSNASQDILKRVAKAGVNDDVVYDLFPDLVYTRNAEVYAFLIEVLNSDEKNCESADAEHGGKIPCAYRIMEMLAPVIKDYPLTLDASGDINTKDYVAALHTVRTWFKQHPNFVILKDTY